MKIRKRDKGRFVVLDKHGKNLGTYRTKKAAQKRLDGLAHLALIRYLKAMR